MKRYLHKTPIWIQKMYPNFLWQVDTTKKELFLTFDDGPIPEITEFVLEELNKVEAKGTFFCVGENLEKNPDLSRRLVNEGHVIGNHTHNHLKGWQTANYSYWRNVLKCEHLIEEIQGSKKLFRPPYGRIKRSQAAALSRFEVVMWNRLSWDFGKNLDIELAKKHLMDVTPGSVVVFHDNIKSFKNLKQLLPFILSYYSKEGWEMKALGDR